MEKAFITFWICLAIVICTIVGCITFSDISASSKNNVRLACIEAHGDWTSWSNSCTFSKESR